MNATEAIVEAYSKLSTEEKLAVLKELIKIEPLWPFDFCAGCADDRRAVAGECADAIVPLTWPSRGGARKSWTAMWRFS